jgi:hypothetical protein
LEQGSEFQQWDYCGYSREGLHSVLGNQCHSPQWKTKRLETNSGSPLSADRGGFAAVWIVQQSGSGKQKTYFVFCLPFFFDTTKWSGAESLEVVTMSQNLRLIVGRVHHYFYLYSLKFEIS